MTRTRRLVLNLGAVLGAVCVLAALAAVVMDVRPMVFRSGSMAPAIDTGALALVHRVDATALAEGDVVTVPTAAGTLVTHRIVELTSVRDGATLRLRGDANEAIDQQTYHLTEADRLVASAPRVGYAVGWLTGPLGRFALGVYAVFLVMVLLKPTSGAAERARRRPPVPGRRCAPKSRTRIRSVTIAAMVVLLGAAGVTRAAPGWAAWTDTMTVSGTTLGAHVVLPPDAVNCSRSGATATMSWTEKDSRYDYEVVLKREDGTPVSTRQVTGTGTSTAYTAPGDFGLNSMLAGQFDFTVEVRSYLASPTNWRGADVRVASQRIRVSFLTFVASAECV